MMNSMQSAGSLHYSTVGVTESRRFEYWNDVVLRHCIPAASAPLAGVDFDARLTVRGVGLVDMCSLSAPLHSWDRTARYLRQGPDDDLWLGYMQDGYGQLEQGGRKNSVGVRSNVRGVVSPSTMLATMAVTFTSSDCQRRISSFVSV